MIENYESTKNLMDKIESGEALSSADEKLFADIKKRYSPDIRKAFGKWFRDGRLKKLLTSYGDEIYDDLEFDVWLLFLEKAKLGIGENFYENPGRFLYFMARNEISNFSRKIEGLHKKTLKKAEVRFESTEVVYDAVSDMPGELCEEEAVQNDLQLTAREEYMKEVLKEQEYKVLQLESEGLTQSQISEVMDISVSQIYLLKKSALRKAAEHKQIWLDQN